MKKIVFLAVIVAAAYIGYPYAKPYLHFPGFDANGKLEPQTDSPERNDMAKTMAHLGNSQQDSASPATQDDARSAGYLNRVAMNINRSDHDPGGLRNFHVAGEHLHALGASAADGMLIYRYRFENKVWNEVDSQQIANERRQYVVGMACSDGNTRPLLNQGVVVRYAFVDKDGINVTSLDVNPNDCQ